MSDPPMDDARVSAEDLVRLCPQATHLMALLGEPVDSEYLDAFAHRYGTRWLKTLTDGSQAIRRFDHASRTAFGRQYWELLEFLLLEHWISEHPRRVGRALGEQDFATSLVALRGNIGLALYSRARSVNWQEPLTFSRALRVSELYLRSVLQHRHLLKPRRIQEFEGRLGVALVLQARYANLGADSAREMVSQLKASIEGGNKRVDAIVYLAEALLRTHDACGDVAALTELVALESHPVVSSTPSDLLTSHIAEGWFRLSQEARSDAGVRKCRSAVELRLTRLAATEDALVRCRAAIIAAFMDVTPEHVVSKRDLLLRGLRTPFGVKVQVRRWRKTNRGQTLRLLRALDTHLSGANKRGKNSLMHRSLAASVKSELASLLTGQSWTSQKISFLRAAVFLREGAEGQPPLRDPESRLENSLDRFELFRSTGARAHLVSAIADTLELIDFDQAWPTPLLVLARELEGLEGELPMQVAYELRRLTVGSRGILALALAGDAKALYRIAAERALVSREVDRKHLGGRSGVYLAEDYSGIVSETFVFKPTTAALAEREATRVADLEIKLKQTGLEGSFFVPATLAQSELPDDDVLRRQGSEVLVARQFHFGTILADALHGTDLAVRTKVLESVVRFLAVIHAAESGADARGIRMRRELSRKDFGRWLRTGLQLPEWQEVFDTWWDQFGPDPMPLARRDAHPLNWIITPGGGVVAVDFEACGWRPVGYEVAQLLDDRPLLPVDDLGWKTRRHLLKQYRRKLREMGLETEHHHLMRAWEAGTVARAVGVLTSPASDSRLRHHGEELLHWLAANGQHPEVRELAGKLEGSWKVRRGVATSSDNTRHISDARRRHLSRAMAYELRHGSTLLLDRRGWAYLAAVSDALNNSGLRTDPGELAAVASAIDEPRFEVAEKKVRARYGHTREVDIIYEDATLPKTLYHGTASGNLHAIFVDGHGLKSMGRLWVHLSSDPGMALRTAERHGPVVLLSLDVDRAIEPIFHAGGPVFLTASVPASALRIVSPTELFLTSTPAPALFTA